MSSLTDDPRFVSPIISHKKPSFYLVPEQNLLKKGGNVEIIGLPLKVILRKNRRVSHYWYFI